MPAAAVTPAPIAYIKVVAVKKLVVGNLALIPDLCLLSGGCVCRLLSWPSIRGDVVSLSLGENTIRIFYFEKIRVFKAGFDAFEYISME